MIETIERYRLSHSAAICGGQAEYARPMGGGGKAGEEPVKQNSRRTWSGALRTAALVGLVMTAVTLVLRVVLMPTLLDGETGRFSMSAAVIALMVLTLAALAVLGALAPRRRIEVTGSAALPTALLTMLAGGVLTGASLWECGSYILSGAVPEPQAAQLTGLATPLLWLYLLCGMAGGVGLVYFGLHMAAEGGTRIGMSAAPLLLPVLWMWFRLARYEMSYASAVRLSESFYDFVMFILEMLFLFKLARYASGIGNTTPGSLLFYALGTALFAITGPLTRLCMFLIGDTEAYLASRLPGVTDLAIGVMALGYALAWVYGQLQLPPEGAEEEPLSVEDEEEETPSEESGLALPGEDNEG